METTCRFCGYPARVRQVPCPIPVSDCYCAGCASRCREFYWGFAYPMVSRRPIPGVVYGGEGNSVMMRDLRSGHYHMISLEHE